MSEAAEVATPETIHPAPVFALEAFETRAIPLRDLHESLKNPRRIYVGIEELAESIRKEGLRVAIVARPRIDQGSGFEIAAGHRRYRAAKLAGVEVVPVHVRDLTDAQLVDWLAFENDHRENPNDLGYSDLSVLND